MRRTAPSAVQRPVVEDLEPRILFAADHPAGMIAAAALLQNPGTPLTERVALAAPAQATGADAQDHASELVFIDKRVANREQLFADIAAQAAAGRSIEAIELDDTRDGIAQITEALATRSDIASIHVISHGTEAYVLLGSTVLGNHQLLERADDVAAWGSHLAAGADLLLYGCDIGAGADGRALVDGLAQLTGVDVAASNDSTGRGGSLRTAITSANSNPGADIISFAITGGGVQTIALSSALPAITDQVTIDGYTQAGSSVNTASVGTNAALTIELNGAGAGAGAVGLDLAAGSTGSTVRGLVINGFGTTAASAILVSGGSGQTIVGNFIGTNAAGTAASVNYKGVSVDTAANVQIGGPALADRNLISGSLQDNIAITQADGTLVRGNAIGTNAAGSAVIGSTVRDIYAFNAAGGTQIGGSGAGAGNVIAGGLRGVAIEVGGSVAVLGNSIYGSSALAIDLNGNGVSANDAGDFDNGPNGLQNFPVLTSARTDGSNAAVTGTLNSAPNSHYRIELFANTSGNASGHGGGLRYLGFVNVTTDASGNASFNAAVANLAVGEVISATASVADASFTSFTASSEFAQNISATAAAVITSSAAVNVAENTTTVTTVVGSSSGLSYSLVGGADQARFAIDAATGTLRFIAAPDFEHPLDAGMDNVYDVTVQASDGVLGASQALTVMVGNVNETPTIGSASGGQSNADRIGYDEPVGMALQADGKVIVVGRVAVGSMQFGVARWNADGTLDASFGTDGLVVTVTGTESSFATSVQVQSDGKILVAGYSESGGVVSATLVRYLADGSLDPGFGVGGIVHNSLCDGENLIGALQIQADGKIVISGTARVGADVVSVLARFNSQGALDAGFGTGGIVTTVLGLGVATSNQSGLALQADGKIVVGTSAVYGSSFDAVLLRFSADGTPDTAFNANGQVVMPIGNASLTSIALQGDGKIVAAGRSDRGSDTDFVVLRVDADGTLDNSFNGNGELLIDFGSWDSANSVVVQADGRIVVSGQSVAAATAIVRLNADGTLDAGFNGSGGFTTNAGYAVASALTLTGQLVVAAYAGNGDFAALHFNPDGSLDASFNGTAPAAYTENAAPIALSSSAAIFDAELNAANNYAGATLTLARHGGANAQDVFGATGALGTLTQGSSLVYAGTTIGTVTANGAGTLVLSFNANATQAVVNDAVRTIGYANSSPTPPAQVRIDWSLDDGNAGAQGSGGVASGTGFTLVNITAVDNAPVITSNGGGASAALTQAENTSAVTTVTATDLDGPALSYAISGGADAAKFTIDAGTGALSFITAPDFESPLDTGANNVYDVIVRVSDGTLAATQVIAVTVSDVSSALVVTTATDVDDAGFVAGNAAETAEWLNAHRGADGAVSLREAINAANNTAGADTISFNIAGAGLHTIELTAALPDITDRLTIDGYTQAGASVNTASVGTNAVLTIELDGTATGWADNGLTLAAGSGGSTIRGLVLNQFAGGAASAILISSDANVIAGNFIGTDATGAVPRHNTLGVSVSGTGSRIGGTALADRNLISANDFVDVRVLDASGTLIYGNAIGTNAAADAILSDAYYAVYVDSGALGTQIGGIALGQGNIISGSENAGVGVLRGTPDGQAAILGNVIYGPQFMGIDLATDGLTPNGVDTAGPNALQHFPVLTSAQASGTTPIIVGSLDAPSGYYRVEFFANADIVGTGTGHGPGQRYLGAVNVAIDATGHADFSATLASALAPGEFVSATATKATDWNYNSFTATSEFAQNITATALFTISGSAAISIAENTSTVTTVTASVGGLTYSLIGGADQARFTIDATTGALSFTMAPDFEQPLDAGANNVYDVIVQASDGAASVSQAIAVTITDVSNALVVTSATDNNDAGIVAGAAYTNEWLNAHRGADGAVSLREAIIAANNTAGADTIAFAIAGAGLHTIDLAAALPGVTDRLTIDGYTQAGSSVNSASIGTNAVLAIELNGSASGGAGGLVLGAGSDGSTIRGLVINRFASGAGIAILSNTNLLVGNFIGTGADGLATQANHIGIINYSGSGTRIGSAALADRNLIAGNSYSEVLEFGTSSGAIQGNYIGTDATGGVVLGNSYNAVAAYNGGSGIQIGGIGAGQGNVIAGSITGAAYETTSAILGNAIYGNAGLRIGNVLSASAAVLNSVQTNGTRIAVAGTLDLAANSFYRIELFANTPADATGQGAGQRFLSYLNVTTDGSGHADFDTVLTNALAAGDSIGATVSLATDASVSAFTLTWAFSADASADSATVFTGGASSGIAENTVAVTTVAATGTGLTYSIAGGADAARFTIDAVSGALSFVAAPDFEQPGDTGANNVYDVIVRASSAALSSDRALVVTVTNANEAPVGVPRTITLPEDTAHAFSAAEFGFADPDAGDALSALRIDSLPDDGTLTLAGVAVGVGQVIVAADVAGLVFAPAANTHGGTAFGFSVRDPGGLYDRASRTLTLAVTAVDDAPQLAANAGLAVAENVAIVTTVAATDADLPTQTLRYAIAGGADAARFTIDAASGALAFISAPDFEAPMDADHDNVYELVVRVDDGALGAVQVLSVTVTPVDDNAPIITSDGGAAQARIAALGDSTAVTQVIAIDRDLPGPTLSFAIVGGADAARFVIDAASGRLAFVVPQGSSTAERVYDVIVEVSDGSTATHQRLSVVIGAEAALPPTETAPEPAAPTPAPAPNEPTPVAQPEPVVTERTTRPAVTAKLDALPTPSEATQVDGATRAAAAPGAVSAAATALRIASLPRPSIHHDEVGRVDAGTLLQTIATKASALLSGDTGRGARLSAAPADDPAANADDGSAQRTLRHVAASAGAVVSLGLVAWAARGTALIASVFVSSPAWRSYDLLPVLRRRDEDADWGDDDAPPSGDDADDDTVLGAVRATGPTRSSAPARHDHDLLEIE